jgi:hypothetical protein
MLTVNQCAPPKKSGPASVTMSLVPPFASLISACRSYPGAARGRGQSLLVTRPVGRDPIRTP